MGRHYSFIPLMNSILAAVFLILTEFINKLETIISVYTGLASQSPIVSAMSGIALVIILWIISRISILMYDKLFFQKFGWGGSKRGTYMYLALQKMLTDETGFEVTSNKNEKVVRILGVFFLDDTPSKTTIDYAEAYYWDGSNKFERRGSWLSHHVKTDENDRIEVIYEIKVDRNQHGIVPNVSKWRGALDMRKQAIGDKRKSLVLGIEAWRGISEGKKFESTFYCERLTVNSFLSAKKIHQMIIENTLSEKLASKLPL